MELIFESGIQANHTVRINSTLYIISHFTTVPSSLKLINSTLHFFAKMPHVGLKRSESIFIKLLFFFCEHVMSPFHREIFFPTLEIIKESHEIEMWKFRLISLSKAKLKVLKLIAGGGRKNGAINLKFLLPNHPDLPLSDNL